MMWLSKKLAIQAGAAEKKSTFLGCKPRRRSLSDRARIMSPRLEGDNKCSRQSSFPR
jgi:hypothetical protein